MSEVSSTSPVFVPRRNFMTTPSPLAGISLDWGDSVECMDHLLIALQVSGLRVALVLVGADWNIAGVLLIPLEFRKCHPGDDGGGSWHTMLRMVRNGRDFCEGLLCVEQIWYRNFQPDPPQPGHGGTNLSSWNCCWYRFTCRLDAASPMIACDLVRTEPQRFNVSFCPGGRHGYWFSSSVRLPPQQPLPLMIPAEASSLLDISEAGADGLPTHWHRVQDLDWAYNQSSPSSDLNRILINETRPFDRDHAVSLVTIDGKLYLTPIRLVDGEVMLPRRFALPRGFRTKLAWTLAPEGGGTLWFHATNLKKNPAKHESALWRVDYGANLVEARQAKDAIRVTRVNEDHATKNCAVLDYGGIALAMWQGRTGIRTPYVLRCVIQHRLPGAERQVLPDWHSEPADEFLPSLPADELSDIWAMGPNAEMMKPRIVPRASFRFGSRLGAAILRWQLDPCRAELTIGEVTFDASGTGLFDHP